MKTERFDDELRRKMLGLPAETDASEVDRIFGYVSANRPGKPGTGWQKALLYGTAGAVLIGSVLYSINQYHTNKYLYSSIDSLKQQYAVSQLQPHSLPGNGPINKPDTVYITRYRDHITTEPQAESAGTFERGDELALRPSMNPPFDGSNLPATITQPTGSTPPVSQVIIPLAGEPLKGANVAGKQLKRSTDSVLNDPNRPLPNPINDRVINESANREKPVSDSRRKSGIVRLSTRQRSGDPLDPTESLLMQPGQTEENTKDVRNESGNSEVSMDRVPEPSGAVLLNTDFLSSRQLPQYALNNSLVRPVKAAPVTSGLTPRHRLYWTFPKVAVASSSLWAGAGVSLGHEQLSSSLLGEWRLNSHWSIQTGVQLTLQGDHFFSDDDFQKRTRQDFRTLYAPSIPSSYELLDISQSYQLVQLPLTVAYHYPLGHNWSLRLGVGTSINLYARNRFTFDYRESSFSNNQGLYKEPAPVSIINTVTVSAGVERQWKGWLFRASPFISPLLKPVVRTHDDLFWGVQIGILHRFGGR
jgi:hypothetical protein